MTSGLIAFRLETKTREVRVRYPEGVSTVSDADLTLSPAPRSAAKFRAPSRSGGLSINPKSDTATILASAAQPIEDAGSGHGRCSPT